MKNVLGILALMGVSGLAVHFMHALTSPRESAQLREQESTLRAEFRNHLNRTRVNNQRQYMAAANANYIRRTSENILDDLIQHGHLKDNQNQNGTEHQRRLIALFEELERQADAREVTSQFLGKFKDVEYGYPWNQGTMDYLAPPTLRIGLMNLLVRLGDSHSERILVDQLETTALPIEVMFLAFSLEKMNPGMYRETVLKNVHDLLNTAFDEEDSKSLAITTRPLLYALLLKYNDHSYARAASEKLVTQKGQVDRAALKYLNHVMGSNVMPIIQSSLNHPNLDPKQAGYLRELAVTYLAESPVADQIIQDRFTLGVKYWTQPRADSEKRKGAYLLNYYLSAIASAPSDATENHLQKRIHLLNDFRLKTGDPVVNSMMERAKSNLRAKIEKLKRPELIDEE